MYAIRSYYAHLARQQNHEILELVVASRWVENAEIMAILQDNQAAVGLLPVQGDSVV